MALVLRVSKPNASRCAPNLDGRGGHFQSSDPHYGCFPCTVAQISRRETERALYFMLRERTVENSEEALLEHFPTVSARDGRSTLPRPLPQAPDRDPGRAGGEKVERSRRRASLPLPRGGEGRGEGGAANGCDRLRSENALASRSRSSTALARRLHHVMPGLVPGIHVLRRRGANRERARRRRNVDARNKSGHDERSGEAGKTARPMRSHTNFKIRTLEHFPTLSGRDGRSTLPRPLPRAGGEKVERSRRRATLPLPRGGEGRGEGGAATGCGRLLPRIAPNRSGDGLRAAWETSP